ncbi:MAG TPA: hypothetical protein VK944_04640, partial [Candidatus Limnocylindria bacterium]|nr:hypothetical protein [Candidatus Limnocylindria bacterium]
MEETIEYKTTRINMAKIGPRYFGSNRDAGKLVIDSTIQEIIMPGLSIVFPHFPMMALSLFSPLQDSIDTGAIQNIAFSAPHPPREAGAGGIQDPVVSLPRDVASMRNSRFSVCPLEIRDLRLPFGDNAEQGMSATVPGRGICGIHSYPRGEICFLTPSCSEVMSWRS